MGQFSDNAIGFFLQIDASDFNTTLDKSREKYRRFVDSLEKYNQRAFESASAAMNSLEELVSGMGRLPERLTRNYDAAIRKLKGRMKPLTQKVTLDISAKEEQKLGGAVAKRVATLLRNAEIRLSAAKPLAKNPMFSGEESLKSQYSDMPQPPDMKGQFQNIPRFQKGGVVEGEGFTDKVLAYLTPGEMVLPKDTVEQFKEMGMTKAPKAIKDSTREVQNMGQALQHVKKAADLGLDPEAPKLYKEGMTELREKVQLMYEQSQQLSESQRKRMNPALREATETLESLEEKSSSSEEALSDLQDAAKPTKFVMMSEAAQRVVGSLNDMMQQTSQTMSMAEGQEAQGAQEALNESNQMLAITRSELRELKTDAYGVAQSVATGPSSVANAMNAMVQAGYRDTEMLRQYSGLVAEASVATNAAQDSIARYTMRAQAMGQMSESNIRSTVREISSLSEFMNVSAQDLIENTSQRLGELQGVLNNMTEDQRANAVRTLSKVEALVNRVAGEGGEEISNLVSSAMKGNTEAISQMSQLTNKGIDEIRNAVKSGRAEELILPLIDRMQGASSMFREQFAESVGVSSQQLQALGRSGDEASEILAKMQGKTAEAAKNHDYLADRANANQSIYEKLSEAVAETIGSLGAFGVKVADVMSLVNEINPALIISVFYTGKAAVSAISAAGGFTGLATSIGSATVAVGSFLAAAAPFIAVAASVAFAAYMIYSYWDEVFGADGTLASLFNAGYYTVMTNAKILWNYLESFGNWMKDSFVEAWEAVTNPVETLGNWIEWLVGWFYDAEDSLTGHSLVPALDALYSVSKKIWPVIKSSLVPALKTFKGAVDFVTSPVKHLTDLLSNLKDIAGNVLGKLMSITKTVGGGVADAAGWAKGKAEQAVSGIASGAASAAGAVGSTATGAWNWLTGEEEATPAGGPPLPKAQEIQDVVKVKLAEGSNDDVVQAIEGLYAYMREMIDTMSGQAPVKVEVPGTSKNGRKPRYTGEETRGMSLKAAH